MEGKIKHIEIYSNGVAQIHFHDGGTMLINEVHFYLDAVLNGWEEEDVGVIK